MLRFFSPESSVGPKVRTHQKQISVRRSDRITIRCEADGDQPLNVSWQVKGNRIDPTYDIRYQMKNSVMTKGVTSELTIIQTTLTDRGEYTCMATNAYGYDHSVVYLQVQEPPSFPTNLHVTELDSRTVTLSWSLDMPASTSNHAHHFTQPITNYILQFKEAQDVWHDHNNQKMLPGDKTMAKITSLKPATNYHFRLYAVNQLGTSAPSDILHVQTEAEVPSGPPVMVTVEPLGSEQLLVTWRPPERELWNGELHGYKIGFQKIGNAGNFLQDASKLSKIQHQFYNFTRVGLSGGDGVSDFRLINLDKYTQYAVIVQAFNAKGDGPPSESVYARTLEDVPSAPTLCTCIALTSQNIQVSWKPPLNEHEHGVIQGYKILYEPGNADGTASDTLSMDYNDNIVRETKITTALNTVLHGLQPFTNYSLQILAFTRAGEGPAATASCMTEETVPDPPERIKSVVMSETSVMISWLPPRRPNGLVTKYTIYIRILDKGQEIKIMKGTVLVENHHYEAKNLSTRESYEAWVTASTRIGQGQSTPVIKLMPSSSVPAAIVSFGQILSVAWRVDLKLSCQFVGRPTIKSDWKILDSKR